MPVHSTPDLCPECGRLPKRVVSGRCEACYMRAYRAANPGRTRETQRRSSQKRRASGATQAYMARYRAEHREQIQRQRQVYRQAHREQILAYAMSYHWAHREKRLAYLRSYFPAYRQRRRDDLRAYDARYRTDHQIERARASQAYKPRRNARLRQRRAENPEHFRQRGRVARIRRIASVRAIVFARDRGLCHLCGKPVARESMSLDHVVPRSHGGTNDVANLRCAHLHCNQRRQNRGATQPYLL